MQRPPLIRKGNPPYHEDYDPPPPEPIRWHRVECEVAFWLLVLACVLQWASVLNLWLAIR